jgi:hypothetical protein
MANFKKHFLGISLQQTDYQMNENEFPAKNVSKTVKLFEN